MRYIDTAAERFFEFTGHLDTSRDWDNFSHLQDYLCVWLEEPEAGGVEYTGRNYETWLRTALHIADAVFKNPSLLDYRPTVPDLTDEEFAAATPEEHEQRRIAAEPRPRPIEGIIDPDNNSSYAFDRHYYEVQVWRQDHPERTPEGQLRARSDSSPNLPG